MIIGAGTSFLSGMGVSAPDSDLATVPERLADRLAPDIVVPTITPHGADEHQHHPAASHPG